jgi:branched-chain amino acid transport system permease protein
MDIVFVLEQALTQSIGIQAIIYCLAAAGLNIQFGYTGLLNFGQVAFMIVGGYSIAATVLSFGGSFWTALVVGIISSLILSLLLGLPTLRLRADYLAIVTIATSEILRLVVRSVALREWFGGVNGLNGKFAAQFYALNPYQSGIGIGPIKFSQNDSWVVTVGWILVAIVILITFLLTRSPWGRILKGIREDEEAIRSLGKSVYWYKMQALMLGGVMGTLAGFIFAIASQSVQPDSYVPDVTFFAYTILLLGGAARVFGPVVGSIIFWFLLVFIGQTLDQTISAGYIPFLTSTQVGPIRFIFVGIGLMCLIIFRPQGIFGDRKELALDGR